MYRETALQTIAIAVAAFLLALGLWAFFDPASFFDHVANFPPYNKHLLHDVGAFQIGLGAALLLALLWKSDALLAALAASGLGALFHFVSHVQDRSLGGRAIDPWSLGLLAAVLLLAALWKWTARPRL